jgi:hypothetical protein
LIAALGDRSWVKLFWRICPGRRREEKGGGKQCRDPTGFKLIDTNVLVPFRVRDHSTWFERGRRLIKHDVVAKENVLISLMVLPETAWLLRRRYGAQKSKS